MKKYLMTGMAAIAFCAAFTSCSKDENLYDPKAIEEMETAQVYEAYNKAFIATFGQVHPNQTWGFGSSAKTRNHGIDGAINVNGNMWTGAPAVEVPGEVNAIYDYVKYTLPEMDRLGHLYATEVTDILNGYFVTQVRNGLNDDNKDKNANNSLVTNEGNYMNHLQVAFNANPSMDDLNNATSHDNKSGWEHINNFNASQNANWANDQSELHGNTKVENKGAYDFAYHNSLDSKYHNNWILVDGYNITADHRFKDFYYVCFDFESMPDGVKTEFTFTGKNDSGVDQSGYNGKVDGYYSSVDEIKAAWTAAGITKFTGADGKERNISEMKNITITGYEKGDKVVFPDDVHTDWIIRITKGGTNTDPTAVRIMAEDLNAEAKKTESDIEDSDWDFNDVVFDVTFNEDGSATVQLVAAGGVLPLRIYDGNGTYYEVHERFRQSRDSKTGWYPMINTGGIAQVNGITAQPFTVYNPGEDGKNIKIEVNKFSLNDDGTPGADHWYELTADEGKPAAKFAVKTSVQPLRERTHIDYQSSGAFSRAVQDGTWNWIWW